MISRGNGNFIRDHYDWLVAALGGLALLGGVAFYALSLGSDADRSAADAVRALDRRKPAESRVEKPDLSACAATMTLARNPTLVPEVRNDRESFLASECRVKCQCGQVIVAGLTNCPACKKSLVIVKEEDVAAKKVADWEAKFGVKADDADKDGDGFTNREEYELGFDPTDGKNHPDYLDSLKLTLPLKETYVPFALVEYTKLPKGWRCVFNNVKRTARTTATVGEEIVLPVSRAVGKAEVRKTGYVLKSFEKKEREGGLIAGTQTKKMVDISVAEVERKSDGKIVPLELQNPKRVKLTPVDVQAKLVYERGGTKTFDVVAGDVITLSGEKYKIVGVKAVNKGAEVTLENQKTNQRKVVKSQE